MDTEISKRLNSRIETVANILNEYDREALLVKNKKIYFLGSEKDAIKSLFTTFGFDESNLVEEIGLCDIIFIHDDKNFDKWPDLRNKSDAQIMTLVKEWENQNDEIWLKWKPVKLIIDDLKNNKKCFFFYSNNAVQFPIALFPDLKTKARINFATNPAQIYGNLLNTLKYQDKLQKS